MLLVTGASGFLGANVLSEAPHLLVRRRIGFQELLAEPQRAEGEAERLRVLAMREARQLHAAAAEIEKLPTHDREPSHGAGEPITRLRQPIDHLDVDAQLSADPGGERQAVGGVTHRSGRDGNNAQRACARGDGLEVAERVGRPRDRRLGQLAVRVDVVDEPQRRARSGTGS